MPGRHPVDDIRNLLSFDDFEHPSVTSSIRGRQGAEKLALTLFRLRMGRLACKPSHARTLRNVGNAPFERSMIESIRSRLALLEAIAVLSENLPERRVRPLQRAYRFELNAPAG